MLVPLALVGLGVRLLLTPAFLQVEYRLPSFPPDEYGFTTEDRLHWGLYGVSYLVNDAGISYLGNLSFDDGSPLFNQRELSHMQDVKVVTRRVLHTWYWDLAILVALGLWAWSFKWLSAYRDGLRLGGWLTLALAGTVGVIGTIGATGSGDLFWSFFSDFHALFFTGDSWLFAFSDSLIRLYPVKFWEDAALSIAMLAALGAMGLVLGLRSRRGGVASQDSVAA
jgi:integral membrane protein (TIGR01906 family)